MKKNIIIAAIAAASALLLCASCQKQELIEQNNVNASGKTFTATIEGLTKTTITNEYKVNWVEGDQIDINGSIFSATPDASDATKASLTKVSGSDPIPDYTAVYPASIMVGTQATLPATQTYAAGKFNAPMCAMSSTETLEFKNFCGVLCFALKGTDKVKSIAVTANEQLCGPFEFADATSIIFGEENKGYTVTLDCGEGVQLSSTDSTNFYVYLPPKDSYTAGMKIVVTSTEGKTFEKTTTTAVKIEKNNLYTFNWTASFSGSAEPEYVEIGGVKWATKNLGATTVAGSGETCYGDYYAWGETAPYYEGTGGWPATPTWKSGKASGYAWLSYCSSSGFSEWSTPPYDVTTKILKPEFDAAAQILGNGWRMPTSVEFKALYDACLNGSYDKTTNPSGASASVGKGVYWCTNYDGVAGCLFCDGTNKLFFPAAGYGSETTLDKAGEGGFYWSSSLSTGTTGTDACRFRFATTVKEDNYYRFCGYSVRPVKAAAAPLPAGALSGEFSVSATKKVHFSQGNLQATYNSSASTYTWGFAANQYSYIGNAAGNTTIDSQTNGAVVDLFGWVGASSTAFTSSPEIYGVSTSTTSSDYGDVAGEALKADWGVAYCESNEIAAGTWRTLTTEEWQYLFSYDGSGAGGQDYDNETRRNKYKYCVTVCNKPNCVVLLPDVWDETVISLTDFTNTTEYSETTAPKWSAMEAAGAVCLPAAGGRLGSDVFNVGVSGNYWSSTAYDSDNAIDVYFYSDDVLLDILDARKYGYSVRLVQDVMLGGGQHQR